MECGMWICTKTWMCFYQKDSQNIHNLKWMSNLQGGWKLYWLLSEDTSAWYMRQGHYLSPTCITVLSFLPEWATYKEGENCIDYSQKIHLRGICAKDITYHPPALPYWVFSLGSLTTIRTWAHAAIATHMKAAWTNDPNDSETRSSHLALRTL